MNKENLRDEISSIHSMCQSFQNHLLIVMGRGEINENLKEEMLKKLFWMAERIKEM